MSSIGERARELTIEYLTGSISEPHVRELESFLREYEEARIAFLNETHFDSQLGMLLVDSRVGSQVSEGVEEPADVARGRLRVARPKAIERPSERGMSFPGFARRMIPFAAAAAVLAIVGVYFLFTQAGPRGVDKLIAQARSVRTVADMKALNGPSQEAYQRELAQREGCNLMRLVSLGLATAITGNPREDRQAEDLRFVLKQAAKAGAEWQVARRSSGWGFSLIPVAEAAIDVSSGGGITATEHHGFRETYAKARELARGLYYDQYIQTLESATANFAPQSLLRQAVGFEGGYVYLCERDFARAALAYADGHITSALYREYYLEHLRPSLAARAKREQELEDNLDLRNQAAWETFGNGRWTLSETNGCLVIAQTNKDAKDAYLYLGGKSFQEAIFTGLVRVEHLQRVGDAPSHFAMVCYYSDMHSFMTCSSCDFPERWSRIRWHVSYREGSCWAIRTEKQLEGGDGILNAVVKEELTSRPFLQARGRAGLLAHGVSLQWANLGLEIIKP